jgi:hypothetical protein
VSTPWGKELNQYEIEFFKSVSEGIFSQNIDIIFDFVGSGSGSFG